MRVLFLTLYPATMPSSRLRVYQYIPLLKNYGIDAQILPAVPEPWFSRLYFSELRALKFLYCFVEAIYVYFRIVRAKNFDAVVVQKGLTSSVLHGLENKLRKQKVRIFFDFDDDVLSKAIVSFRNPFLNRLQDPAQNQKIAAMAEAVIAGSEHLCQKALGLNPRSYVVPTPVDTDRFSPASRPPCVPGRPLVIGWIGQEAGLPYLLSLRPVFFNLAEHYDIQIRVISRLSGGAHFVIPGVETYFVPWTYQTEVEACREFDIGVMPIPQDTWGAGKCGLKLLQYMALGIPAVATDVGANREIVQEGHDAFLAITPQDWESKLSALLDSATLRQQMGAAAREKVVVHYSLKVQAPRLAEMLNLLKQSSCRVSCGDPLQFALPSATLKNTDSLKKPLRILLILPELKLGGAENQFIRLAEGLRQKGHDARILCTFADGRYASWAREKNIPVDVLGAEHWGLKVMNDLMDYLSRNKFDVVHTCVFSLHVFVGVPARKAGVPVIISSRRGLGLYGQRKLLLLERIGNLFADHIVGNALAVKDHFKKKEGLSCSKISSIYNGLHLSEFVPGLGRAKIRAEFNIPKDSPLIGTIANFSVLKGYRYLVDAAKIVLQTLPNARFLFVGDGPLLNPMRKYAGDLDSHSILFAGSRRDVADFLDAFDIFAFASLSEGMPNVVMEAMAMAKPIVATPAGGIPEMIDHDRSGLLVPFRDSQKLAEAILTLINDEAQAKKIGAAARLKVGTEFTMDRMIQSHEVLYEALLRKKGNTKTFPISQLEPSAAPNEILHHGAD